MKTETPKLTVMEKQYFDLLLKFPTRVAREDFNEFHENTWGSNVVDVHMMNLRKKLAGQYEITTLRGFGYSMQKV